MKLNQACRAAKPVLVALVLGCGAMLLHAQVTVDVVFANLGTTLDAPIYGTDGSGLAAPNFCVDLVYDATPVGGSFTTIAATTSQWVQPGYFLGAIAQIPGFDAGDIVTFHVRAWDNAGSGLTFDQATTRNISNPVYMTVPQPPPPGTPISLNLPLALDGLQSFQLQAVPEPSANLGIAAVMCGAWALGRRLFQRRCPR